MKYSVNLNGKTNIIVISAENAALNPDVFEVPDEVEFGWEINEDGNIIRPAKYEDVLDEQGNIVDRIKVEDESIIIIN